MQKITNFQAWPTVDLTMELNSNLKALQGKAWQSASAIIRDEDLINDRVERTQQILSELQRRLGQTSAIMIRKLTRPDESGSGYLTTDMENI